jgi:hypothetical protein
MVEGKKRNGLITGEKKKLGVMGLGYMRKKGKGK